MAKFVSFEDAVKSLGVTAEKLNEMRERGDIHAYRDGITWKFRDTEIDRVLRDMEGGGSGTGSGISGFNLDLDDDAGGSGTMAGKPSLSGLGSEINLDDALSAGSGLSGAKSDIGAMFDGDDLSFDLASGIGKQPAKPEGKKVDPKKAAAESGLNLDDDLELTTGSALDLSNEDDDLVLGEKPDSDITRNPAGSGIGLAKPADSGLSLDEPLELGGSSVDDFALGEESGVEIGAKAAAEAVSGIGADDDFVLTPLQSTEDDEDSGSQVIALDEDSPLGEAPSGAPVTVAGMSGMDVGPMIPEASFSVWNVVALGACSFLLLLCGMCIWDVARNMWLWDQGTKFSSGLMEGIAGLFYKT